MNHPVGFLSCSWDGEYESRAGRNSEGVGDSKQAARAEREHCLILN